MKKIYTFILATSLLSATTANAQTIFSENFDDIPTLLSSGGWTQQNNSVPLGLEIWHSGLYLAIPAYNGADTSYAEASYESTDALASGNISNWLITPQINLNNGDLISFYTTSYGNSTYPDRLDLRLNPLNNTNVGSADTSVGDFNILLLQINPDLLPDSSLYPENYWGQFSVPVSGLSGPTTCRIAFRYNVTDGGGAGTNSTTIGIDAFTIELPVGIVEANSNFELNVYPNPVLNNLSIEFSKPLTENGKVNIYNELGQNVSAFNVSKGQIKAMFNSDFLSKGSYTMVLDLGDTVTKKLFVKN